MVAPNLSLYTVKAVLILDNEGKRVFAKYYQPPHATSVSAEDALANHVENPFPTLKSQKAFEASLFSKTHKQGADVVLLENTLVVYKEVSDIIIYVVGGLDENECMLYSVVLGIRDSLELVLNGNVDKRTILQMYDSVAILIDETVDDGIILETDSGVIRNRVSNLPESDPVLNIEINEKTLFNAYQRFTDRLRSGI